MRTERFRVKWAEFTDVLRNEYRHIFTDAGVILVMIIAVLLYTTVYSLAYKNQVLRDIPIAVVDNCKSPSSHRLIEKFDATPNIHVAYNSSGMEQAKELFYEHKINGIIYVPADYERKIYRGEQVKVGVYVDASYFLMYRQVFADVVAATTHASADVAMLRMLAKGASIPQAQATINPVTITAKNLFNPYGGYASFVMPVIIIVMIQQTLLIGIGMIGGTWRENRTYDKLCPPGEKRLSTVPIVMGKTLAYLSLYAVTMSYILGVHYKMFGYPMNGAFSDLFNFLLPYLLSCIFLGIALSTLFRHRENSLLFMVWCSIPFLLLSGASIPREALPQWLYMLGKVLPSSSGIEGFLRIQTMGANLMQVMPQYITLWVLTGVYFIMACLGLRRVLNICKADSNEQ